MFFPQREGSHGRLFKQRKNVIFHLQRWGNSSSWGCCGIFLSSQIRTSLGRAQKGKKTAPCRLSWFKEVAAEILPICDYCHPVVTPLYDRVWVLTGYVQVVLGGVLCWELGSGWCPRAQVVEPWSGLTEILTVGLVTHIQTTSSSWRCRRVWGATGFQTSPLEASVSPAVWWR